MSNFRISLCNEVIAHLSFAEQCKLAAALGYDGLEIAPFTLSDNPAGLSIAERIHFRSIAESEGIAITGLHWLLNVPEGLSLTSDDDQVHIKTRDHMESMVDLCAELGGEVIVHGSPKQRALSHAQTPQIARAQATSLLRYIGEKARAAGVTYCIEPLSPIMTDFVTNVDEALSIVNEINNPALATMLDTLAAWGGESEAPEDVVLKYLPSGKLRHIHFNDDNHRAPGQGKRRFSPIVKALIQLDYQGIIGIEPFDYHPDGATAAARAIGYVRGLVEVLEERR